MVQKEYLEKKETIRIHRITQDSVKEKMDEVAVEQTVCISLRDGHQVTAVCTPEYIEEFVLGRRYILGDLTEQELEQLQEPEEPLKEVSIQEIFNIIETFFEQPGPLFTDTGCAHSCALIHAGETVCVIEDIGRHNALDKVIGFALRNRIPLASSYIISSGRISGDYLQKVNAAGIPMAVSRAAVTSEAAALAKRNNITMLGFVRKRAGNLYHEGSVSIRSRATSDRAGQYSLLLLAGGKSSRMGCDKAELFYKGKTFVENLLEKAEKLGIKQIFLSGRMSEREGVRSVPDIFPERGPLGGLHACMSVMETPYCLVLPVDVPQIPEAVLDHLLIQHMDRIAGTPDAGFPYILEHGCRKEHLIGIYPVAAKGYIEELIREKPTAVKFMLQEYGFRCCRINMPDWQAENINTVEVYETLMSICE